MGDAESAEPWITVIGVVTDSLKSPLPKRSRGFLPLFSNRDQDRVSETVYLAAGQRPSRSWAILIRTEGTPLHLAPKVRTAIAAIDPDVPTVWITSMADQLAEATWDYRLFGTVFSLFGLVALLLAMIGLYAVMALSVRRRTHEIGLRMALGAQPNDALKLVMVDGLRQLGLGMVLGLGLAAGLARLLTALLFRVEPWDFTIFVGVATVLGLTAALACLVPARWAARVAPMVAIRYE
ncbi:MAG: hypothetical protein GY856_37520 [bacterium]|nr:hypothetical protein [bacterium]